MIESLSAPCQWVILDICYCTRIWQVRARTCVHVHQWGNVRLLEINMAVVNCIFTNRFHEKPLSTSESDGSALLMTFGMPNFLSLPLPFGSPHGDFSTLWNTPIFSFLLAWEICSSLSLKLMEDQPAKYTTVCYLNRIQYIWFCAQLMN